MLVDRGLANGRQVHSVAAIDHRRGPLRQLGGVKAAEHNGHQHRAGLFVGDAAVGVRVDEPTDFGVAQSAAVALGTNQIYCLHVPSLAQLEPCAERASL